MSEYVLIVFVYIEYWKNYLVMVFLLWLYGIGCVFIFILGLMFFNFVIVICNNVYLMVLECIIVRKFFLCLLVLYKD